MRPPHRGIDILFFCLLFALATGAPAAAQTTVSPDSSISASIARFQSLLAPSGAVGEAALDSIFDATVDLRALTDETFGKYLEETLHNYHKVLNDREFDELYAQYERRLLNAFRQRLIGDLAAWLERRQVRRVTLQNLSWKEDRGWAELRVETADGPHILQVHLKSAAESLQIADLAWGEERLSRYYRRLYREIIGEKYSLPVLLSHMAALDYIVLEDFSTTSPGELPVDWVVWREKDQKKPLLYEVRIEDGRHALAARDTGSSVIIAKSIHWNPRDYPIMTWCWKATAIPPGGDERYNDTNDSAAGLYVVFSMNWLGAPKQLKYVWSSTLPVGTVGRRNMIFRPWFFVVESGDEHLGEWTFETVDLEADYHLKLGGRPDKRTVSLQILTDANSTDSIAEAYYTDIRVWKREALDSGKIADHCDCGGSVQETGLPLPEDSYSAREAGAQE